MAEFWNLIDQSRVSGAAGLLAQAAKMTEEALGRGPCPFSSTEIKEAETLSQAAAFLLSRIACAGGPSDGE